MKELLTKVQSLLGELYQFVGLKSNDERDCELMDRCADLQQQLDDAGEKRPDVLRIIEAVVDERDCVSFSQVFPNRAGQRLVIRIERKGE